jgi:Helix-turn-helix domain
MGTRAVHQRNAANRTRHREFAALKFKWLEQVAVDRQLPPLAASVCIWLCRHFNLDEDGAAWPHQETIAQALGISRRWVIKVLQALVERGYLFSEQRGQDQPNLYRMRCADEVSDVNPSSHQKNPDVNSSASRCELQFTHIDTSKIPETTTLSPSTKSGVLHASPQNLEFEKLRKIWRVRPYVEHRKEARQAFVEAVAQTPAATILAGAQAWVAGVQHPRYLPALATWLEDEAWEKPPPAKSKPKRVNGHKPDLSRIAASKSSRFRKRAAAADGDIIDATFKVVQ